MKSIENARQFLDHLKRLDLSQLLIHSRYLLFKDDDEWSLGPKLVIYSPKPFSDALDILPQHDRKRIVEAIDSGDAEISSFTHNSSDFKSVASETTDIQGLAALLPELIINRQLMIRVATGERQIQDVNDYYIARNERIKKTAASLNLEYTNPHDDLWDWFHYWKANFETYAQRRQYVTGLFKSIISAITSRPATLEVPRDPTGWERVDRGLSKARGHVEFASNVEDYQMIGLVCREVIISLAQAVYDPNLHSSLDGTTPSSTDASRMLEAYIHAVFGGESFKEVRSHAKASLNLALNLQHRRTATKQLADLCLEATSSTANVIAIIAKRR